MDEWEDAQASRLSPQQIPGGPALAGMYGRFEEGWLDKGMGKWTQLDILSEFCSRSDELRCVGINGPVLRGPQGSCCLKLHLMSYMGQLLH